MKIPHPIPYQGSKRWIADTICKCIPGMVPVFYEPFAGSAAVSLAASTAGLACPPIPAQTILRPSGPRLPSCPPWPPTLPNAEPMVVSRIFGLWRDFRERLIDRPGLRVKLEPVRIELHAALETGKQCADRRVRRFGRNSSRQGFERLQS